MQIFWGLSLYFKVRNSVFSYVVKSFWYALILLRHTWIKTKKKGVSSKTIYHIRQNRVIYLKIKLEMAINAHFFSVFILCFFFFCVFCVSFSSFATTTTTTTTTTATTSTATITKWPNCKSFWRFHFMQGKQLCFFLWC